MGLFSLDLLLLCKWAFPLGQRIEIGLRTWELGLFRL